MELSGEEALFKPVFYKKGEKLEIVKSEVSEELYYIPNIKLYFSNGDFVIIKIYADIKEKGFIYEFESSEEIEVYLEVNLDKLFFLRFNSHEIEFKKNLKLTNGLKTLL
ncbi:hypothetical protein TheetDRAFT_3059 [Thermoanaerobacter ethanolicus JW 200]|nr:hypothetical protein TheetDRAFT_3059 [Thermoanaerobacter ethanolicus JW 200]